MTKSNTGDGGLVLTVFTSDKEVPGLGLSPGPGQRGLSTYNY